MNATKSLDLLVESNDVCPIVESRARTVIDLLDGYTCDPDITLEDYMIRFEWFVFGISLNVICHKTLYSVEFEVDDNFHRFQISYNTPEKLKPYILTLSTMLEITSDISE